MLWTKTYIYVNNNVIKFQILIIRNCINLQYLSVAFCVRLTDKGFFYLPNATGLRKLVYADLSGCENVC